MCVATAGVGRDGWYVTSLGARVSRRQAHEFNVSMLHMISDTTHFDFGSAQGIINVMIGIIRLRQRRRVHLDGDLR